MNSGCKNLSLEGYCMCLSRKLCLTGTNHVSVAKQLAIFLHYACRGLSNCALQEHFQHSEITIAKCGLLHFWHSVLKSNQLARCIQCLLDMLTSLEVYGTYVRLPTSETSISTNGLFCYMHSRTVSALLMAHIYQLMSLRSSVQHIRTRKASFCKMCLKHAIQT